MIERLANFPRPMRLMITMATDIFISVFSIWVAFSLRFEEFVALDGKWWVLFLIIPLITMPIFIRIGLYRAVIRHFSLHSVKAIVVATSVSIGLWGFVALMSGIQGFPRSVILIGWLALFVLTFLTRFIMYALFVVYRQKAASHAVAIYGTGQSAIQMASTLRSASTYTPVCFVGGDATMYGREIAGLRVYPLERLGELIEKYKIRDFLVIDGEGSEKRRALLNSLSVHPVRVVSIPSVSEIVNRPLELNRFDYVQIEELLGRQKVAPNQGLLESGTTARRVLVTGAGGSIGAQLCHRIFSLRPEVIVLLEQSEYALFEVHRRLRQMGAGKKSGVSPQIIACLGSVEDSKFVADSIAGHAIDIIYHAAAYKHVPLLESNILASVKNNVIGTVNVARAAAEKEVKHFVLVSTDKAVNPISFMGASKRVAEMAVQALAQRYQNTCFAIVRFGNVLGSSGSVVPIFREQIQKGEAVTVTDPEAERYFMTIEEAAELVIQAGAMADSGDIFLLDMGQSVKIVDVARKMIHLSGLRLKNDSPDGEGDIEIHYTGLRPGEKLYESLYSDTHPVKTYHPKIMRDIQQARLSYNHFESILGKIKSMLETRDTEGLRHLFTELMPGFGTRESVASDTK